MKFPSYLRDGDGKCIIGVAMVLLGATSFSSKAHPLEQWTELQSGTNVTELAVGNGLIATIQGAASKGQVVSWPQGDPENRAIVDFPGPLHSIAYGAGRFVLAADSLFVSSNAVDWSTSPSGQRISRSVVFGNGVFLAEYGSSILRSTNGVDWIPQTAPKPFYGMFFLGNTFLLSKTGGTNFLSQDGLDWTPAPSGTLQDLYTAAYGNGRYVAIAKQNELLISSDAVHWTAMGKIDVERPHLAWGNGYFVVVGGNARGYSRDGITWMITPTDLTSYGVEFAPGSFIANGYLGVYQSAPVVALEAVAPGHLALYGVPGANYRVESADELVESGADWETQETFAMPPLETRYNWLDTRPVSAKSRFYRVIQSP